MYIIKKIQMEDGNFAVPAKERILAAIDKGLDYSITTEFAELNNGRFIKCTALLTVHNVAGPRYRTGTSVQKLDAVNYNFAYETAETKAIGRAFAAHGIGIEDNYASYDELMAAKEKITPVPEAAAKGEAVIDAVKEALPVTTMPASIPAAEKQEYIPPRKRGKPVTESPAPVVEPEPAQPEPAQPEPAQLEPPTPAPVDPEPTQPEPPTPVPVEPEPAPVQPEPAQPEPPTPAPAPVEEPVLERDPGTFGGPPTAVEKAQQKSESVSTPTANTPITNAAFSLEIVPVPAGKVERTFPQWIKLFTEPGRQLKGGTNELKEVAGIVRAQMVKKSKDPVGFEQMYPTFEDILKKAPVEVVDIFLNMIHEAINK